MSFNKDFYNNRNKKKIKITYDNKSNISFKSNNLFYGSDFSLNNICNAASKCSNFVEVGPLNFNSQEANKVDLTKKISTESIKTDHQLLIKNRKDISIDRKTTKKLLKTKQENNVQRNIVYNVFEEKHIKKGEDFAMEGKGKPKNGISVKSTKSQAGEEINKLIEQSCEKSSIKTLVKLIELIVLNDEKVSKVQKITIYESAIKSKCTTQRFYYLLLLAKILESNETMDLLMNDGNLVGFITAFLCIDPINFIHKTALECVSTKFGFCTKEHINKHTCSALFASQLLARLIENGSQTVVRCFLLDSYEDILGNIIDCLSHFTDNTELKTGQYATIFSLILLLEKIILLFDIPAFYKSYKFIVVISNLLQTSVSAYRSEPKGQKCETIVTILRLLVGFTQNKKQLRMTLLLCKKIGYLVCFEILELAYQKNNESIFFMALVLLLNIIEASSYNEIKKLSINYTMSYNQQFKMLSFLLEAFRACTDDSTFLYRNLMLQIYITIIIGYIVRLTKFNIIIHDSLEVQMLKDTLLKFKACQIDTEAIPVKDDIMESIDNVITFSKLN